MSLLVNPSREDELSLYKRLATQKEKLVSDAAVWMDNATTFHGRLANAGEKAEVIALRASLIADLKVALGLP